MARVHVGEGKGYRILGDSVRMSDRGTGHSEDYRAARGVRRWPVGFFRSYVGRPHQLCTTLGPLFGNFGLRWTFFFFLRCSHTASLI